MNANGTEVDRRVCGGPWFFSELLVRVAGVIVQLSHWRPLGFR